MEQQPTHRYEHQEGANGVTPVADLSQEQEFHPPISLFLSVPAGLEDVAVRKLPAMLVKVATKISYIIGSGYVTMDLLQFKNDIAGLENQTIIQAIADLVQYPPLCIFAAYVSMGEIDIPRQIFDMPHRLLEYAANGFQDQQSKEGEKEHTTPGPLNENGTGDLGLRWQDALSVLKSTSASLARRLCPANTANAAIRFRGSFDRGNVQHKGVRSQDLAAGLGDVTGKLFPKWRVDLKEFDAEVMGRWIQDDLEEIHYKADPSDTHLLPEQKQQAEKQQFKRMQVGMTLPLALSTCPYRFRPMDGRTALRMEIAYTLLALAGPEPGDVVMDLCSGVGTIPIVGATHYPNCLFVGSEIVPHNVDKAIENSRGMKEKLDQLRSQLSSRSSSRAPQHHGYPSLLMGDARAVCWRPGTVDLIVSDLPWGQRESSHMYNCKLYPRLVKEAIRLLKKNGRAVFVTGERKLLQRQLDAPFARSCLRLLQRREITIGFKVMVFELERI
ncbi:S-adenosyl-L-methionine-dependent methyltransferase [Gamsiella multidivaricata]|uniref:S-adenosyl-L-methionine-dependent methyltransferase n=1 Tax=Gamsiella multidivaricata TaxID=101098 RepID=UPI00221EB9DD|nr:S-adenosyl-L-methionine-dependent methyltransferase [Gamsiella multidivaricata]KAG0356003.1 THUMP domain-containing protein 3 [Gamsiella multidivaricata]KAI7831257.1 S-adenosyl-L-methionine-dependent methyltransferase [Gamsiella multidivaricata]